MKLMAFFLYDLKCSTLLLSLLTNNNSTSEFNLIIKLINIICACEFTFSSAFPSHKGSENRSSAINKNSSIKFKLNLTSKTVATLQA